MITIQKKIPAYLILAATMLIFSKEAFSQNMEFGLRYMPTFSNSIFTLQPMAQLKEK